MEYRPKINRNRIAGGNCTMNSWKMTKPLLALAALSVALLVYMYLTAGQGFNGA